MTTVESSAPGSVAAEESQAAKESEARSLSGEDISVEALAGDGFTYRHDWGLKNGQWILRLNFAAVNTNSRIFVAIGEGDGAGGKFIGAARYTVHNVAPRTGGVDIWVNIEWASPISLIVDYFIVNP
jgi:hypothetical protein